MVAIPLTHSYVAERDQGWIYRKSWDLTYLIFSAVLVPVPLLIADITVYCGLLTEEQAIGLVNLLVAGLVGGPHLWSTFTLTLLDRPFLRRHPMYASSCLVIPIAVVILGLTAYPMLILVFFGWASVHLLHQLNFLADCYRKRGEWPEAAWSRCVDFGVISLGLYPVGLHKLESGEFQVAGVLLPYPEIARSLHLPEVVGGVFVALLILWGAKTAWESVHGRLNVPKTLLILVTAIVSFFLPMGNNLDILFQGYNTWHSVQYLFLFWVLNRFRFERGEIESRFVRWMVSSSSILPYYLCLFAAGGALMLVTLALPLVTPLGSEQSYFIVVLSVLLVHYYFDHFLFTKTNLAR